MYLRDFDFLNIFRFETVLPFKMKQNVAFNVTLCYRPGTPLLLCLHLVHLSTCMSDWTQRSFEWWMMHSCFFFPWRNTRNTFSKNSEKKSGCLDNANRDRSEVAKEKPLAGVGWLPLDRFRDRQSVRVICETLDIQGSFYSVRVLNLFYNYGWCVIRSRIDRRTGFDERIVWRMWWCHGKTRNFAEAKSNEKTPAPKSYFKKYLNY